MAEFPASIALSSLNGSTGFKLNGQAAGDQSGFSVSSAGDINGDGFDDVIVGAYAADSNGTDAGASYVVFGKQGGFTATLALSGLDGTNGFRLTGAAAGDRSGFSVSSAGDVNGDGIDDLVVGASRADANGNNNVGTSYVVFGTRGGFDASLALSSLNGTNGFRLIGQSGYDYSGISVSSAGDVNGDGIDDLIVGASFNSANGSFSGAAYVVFGTRGGFASTIGLSSLNGTNGFKLAGASAGDAAGRSVSSAGDVNGDGFDDLLVGAYRADPNGNYSGSSYVVFGKASGFTATLGLSGLNGTTGFRLAGEAAENRSGRSVSSAGDINGDGFADIIVGAYRADPGGKTDAGTSYVVFGKQNGFASTIPLSGLDGTTGFKIPGLVARDTVGVSVSDAGDVNGDGFADLIVGAFGADPGGEASGASYVVFGRAGGFAATLDLASLNGTNGFRIAGAAFYDQSGISVSSAGDVNGDGFDDLIVGANRADPSGSDSGASYVVFGRAPDAAVKRTGTDVANTISGGAFGDRLTGLAGDDTLKGNAGADALVGGLGADTLTGGAGTDTAVYTGSSVGVDVDLTLATAQSGGEAAGDLLIGIENLQGSAFADSLTGDGNANTLQGVAGDDTLDGGGGADRIDGGTGADIMTGGDGNDVFFVDDSGDGVLEADGPGGGSDTVFATADWTLGDGQAVEFLRANVGTGLALTGNSGNQFLYGAAGDDTLDGGGGRDRLYGGAGDDTYLIGNAGAVVSEAANAGTDTVEASITTTLGANLENLTLTGTAALRGTGNGLDNAITGNAGDNVLDGAGGDDTLTGGLGRDQLAGGTGADSFVFKTLADSLVGANRDLITGFSTSDGDVIDLSAIQAVSGAGTDQAFSFIGSAAFSGTAGELHAVRTGSYTLVEGDVTGDGAADFQILLQGVIVLHESDFVL